MDNIKSLLKLILEKGASDLHLIAGSPPQLRIDGQLSPVGETPLSADQVREICFQLIEPPLRERFESRRELDFSLDDPKLGRYRVNFYVQRGSVAAAFRPIPRIIPRPQDLGVPSIALEMARRPRGLILVTGPTGSGKSTTLASLIDQINSEQPKHIITVEDPIEFIHEHKKSIISQREIGPDSESFKDALKYTLRQDPNVILIGEMRDLETIASAITISETGHLVFATLHTNSAAETINRIIDVFPSHQQPQIRTQLSFVLEGILSQQLVPRIGGGRTLAAEVLVPSPAIRNLIRENKIHQIHAQMQMGQEQSGMQTMNQALTILVRTEVVALEVALASTNDPEGLLSLVKTKGGRVHATNYSSKNVPTVKAL